MLEIQRDLREKLATAFPEAEARLNVPRDVKCPLIVLRREGGRRLNSLQDRPGVGIYCYESSESEAEKLATTVSDFMETLSFADGYETVEQEAMRSAMDPDRRIPRWYLSYTITTHQPKG